MARYRRKARKSYRRSSPVKMSRRRSGNGGGMKPMDIILAGVVYGAARPFAAKMLPDLFSFGPIDSDNAIIGGAGFYALTKQKGFLKALGAVALGSEVGIVTARMTSSATGISSGSDAYQY